MSKTAPIVCKLRVIIHIISLPRTKQVLTFNKRARQAAQWDISHLTKEACVLTSGQTGFRPRPNTVLSSFPLPYPLSSHFPSSLIPVHLEFRWSYPHLSKPRSTMSFTLMGSPPCWQAEGIYSRSCLLAPTWLEDRHQQEGHFLSAGRPPYTHQSK